MMRLAEFIATHVEPILAEWEAFARSIWPGEAADPAELRDHAEAILRATVRDMKTAQTPRQQTDKSHGQSDDGADKAGLLQASDEHGAGRVTSGMDLTELVAEYRALRASVLRLWRATRPDPGPDDLEDLIRFNESIDQSLARAVTSFAARSERSRQMFLAILGHDLRNPLGAVKLSAQALQALVAREGPQAELASLITRSARGMEKMIDDLLEFSAAALGRPMPVKPGDADLGDICRDVVEEARAAHPACSVDCRVEGKLTLTADAARLRQMVTNLVTNAIVHGLSKSPVDVRVGAEADTLRVSVRNQGPPIPPEMLPLIFEPLVRGDPEPVGSRHERGLGLGLYIARAVATAHGGSIGVESSAEAGTTFSVTLPRGHCSGKPS